MWVGQKVYVDYTKVFLWGGIYNVSKREDTQFKKLGDKSSQQESSKRPSLNRQTLNTIYKIFRKFFICDLCLPFVV